MTRPTFPAAGPAALATLALAAVAVAGEPATITISDTVEDGVVPVAAFLGAGCDDGCGEIGCGTECGGDVCCGTDACGAGACGTGVCGSGCKSGLFGGLGAHGACGCKAGFGGYPFGDLGAYGFGDPYATYGYVGPLAGLLPQGGHCRDGSCRNGLGLGGPYGCRGAGFLGTKGCCGYGCGPAGKYGMVYAVDPYYTDPRDGRPYAAAETNLPMAIPTAPTVRHTYNYGWGIPSSRITPLYRHAGVGGMAAGAAGPGSFVVPGSERVLGPTGE